MDEIAKTEARNYLSAAGFFLIGVFWLVGLFGSSFGTTSFASDYLFFVLGIGLLVTATLLVVLRKRDMIALLFFICGFWQLSIAVTAPGIWYTIIAGFMLLAALVTLTAKDRQKWILFLIPLLTFLSSLMCLVFGFRPETIIVFGILLSAITIYLTVCCASERLALPGRRFLTADETTDFKASGSVLGYLLFALMLCGYAVYYFSGGTAFTIESARTMKVLAASLMIVVAVLLLAVGRMRFTPVMFLLLGLCCLAEYCISDTTMFYGIGIAEIVLGLLAVLRKESRILPGIMILFFSSTCFLSLVSVADSPGFMLASGILNFIPCLIAVYLSFVVYSQRKLPRF